MNIIIVPSGFPTKALPRSGWYVKDHAKVTKSVGNVTVCYTDIRYGNRFSIRKDSYIDGGILIDLWTLSLKSPNFRVNKGLRTILYILTTTMHIHQCIRRNKFDLMISHGFRWGGFPAALVRKIIQIPYIAINHSSSPTPYSGFIMKKILHFIEQTAIQILYVSNPQAERFSKICSNHPYAILGNPIDTNTLRPSEFDNEEGIIKILLVGIPSPRKGIDILIKSIRRVLDDNPALESKIQVNIIGESDLIDSYKQMTRKFRVEHLFNFKGFLSREKLVSFIQECSFVVAPSRDEGFSYAVAEALSCGKPVVTTRCGGPEWFVTEDVGIVGEPDSVESFTNGLIYMLENYHKYDPWKLHKHIEDRFSYEKMAKKMRDIISEVIMCNSND